MTEHRASISWKRDSEDFDYDSFSRDHLWNLATGAEIQASSAPEYKGTRGRVDPEKALVAAMASCHMLTFLAIASKRRIPVTSYEDSAVGYLEKNLDGKAAVTRATLSPRVTFDPGTEVSNEELARLHDSAHRNCFIANSVRTEITVDLSRQGDGG